MDEHAERWLAAAEMSWAPPLMLTNRGLLPEAVTAIVLAMAESPVPAPIDAAQLTVRVGGYLEQMYGMNDPDTVNNLLPTVTATYRAVTAIHDDHHVEPVFRQQLRHTLTLDGRYPSGRPDATWEIDHQWKPATPRQRSGATNTSSSARTKAQAEARQRPSTTSRRASVGANTRLDALAATVQAARRRQLARQAATFHGGHSQHE